jgi:predicted DNA-binding transcriptional regulator YafY
MKSFVPCDSRAAAYNRSVAKVGLDDERRINLLAFLCERGSRGATLNQVMASCQWSGTLEAFRKCFIRDKKVWEDAGVKVYCEAGPGGEPLYRVDPSEWSLPEIALTQAEVEALGVVQAMAHVFDNTGWGGLVTGGYSGSQAVTTSVTPEPASLAKVWQATNSRSVCEFRYGDQIRHLEPWVVGFTDRWYVTGYDLDRKAARTFAFDRMGSPVRVEKAGSATHEIPDPLPDLPRITRIDSPDPSHRVVVAVADSDVGSVSRELGATPGEEVAEGWRRVEFDSNFRSGVLGYLLEKAGSVVVLEPADLRQEIEARLTALAGVDPKNVFGSEWEQPPPGHLPERPLALAVGDEEPGGQQEGSEPPRSKRRVVKPEDRLRTLVSILARLQREKTLLVGDLARDFGLSESEMGSVLERLACCGLPPYSPAELFNIVLDDSGQSVELTENLPEAVGRPIKPSPEVALSLVATGTQLVPLLEGEMGVALRSAMSKVARALNADQSFRIEVSTGSESTLGEVVQAMKNRECLEIRYKGISETDPSSRTIEPQRIHCERGHFYTWAYCRKADGWRWFRCDRIVDLRRAGPAEVRSVPEPRIPVEPSIDGSVEVAVLAVRGEARRSVEILPGARLLDMGEWLRVDIPVASEAWLAQQLMRVGLDAAVVFPIRLRGLAARAASQALQTLTSVVDQISRS